MTTRPDCGYAGYRYRGAVIATAAWLYFRFPLSLRMVADMLAARNITVSYEAVRQWSLKFGRWISTDLRRRAPRRGDKWHLGKVVLTSASSGCSTAPSLGVSRSANIIVTLQIDLTFTKVKIRDGAAAQAT